MSEIATQAPTLFKQSGAMYTPYSSANFVSHPILPGNVFTIYQDPHDNLHFDTVSNFSLPSKFYGKGPHQRDRIFNTFLKRKNTTGILLVGEKGSGKSLLAKSLGVKAQEQGIPVILINAPWCSEDFKKLISSVTQPAVLIFDEFEKVYNKEDQNKILTLLDGVYNSQKLCIFTVNDQYAVNQHMLNRPGRIFYRIDYKGCDADFIREYCEDILVDKTQIESIVSIAGLFDEFNFDILQALVEDMNRYGESPRQVLEMLNASPVSDRSLYDSVMTVNGETIDENNVSESTIHGHPLARTKFNMYFNYKGKESDPYDVEEWLAEDYVPSASPVEFTFVNRKGNKLVFTKQVSKPVDMYKYAV